MSTIPLSLLAVHNADELSIAAATAYAMDGIYGLRKEEHRHYEPELSDREQEQVAIETLDYLGLDLIASLDDTDDAGIGRMVRAEYERRVREKLANRTR